MAQATVDFPAVARVSKHAELKDIRLIDVSARCDPAFVGALDHDFTHETEVVSRDEKSLKVSCAYHFVGRAEEKNAIDINITYLVIYTIKSKEPLAEEDVQTFSSANAVLHTWPFVREFLWGLTAKMGLPTFKLGVMHFVPMKPAKKEPQKATPGDPPPKEQAVPQP